MPVKSTGVSKANSDESALSRTRRSLDPIILGKNPGDWVSFLLAVEMAGARLRMVPGAIAHTKGVTG
ncbi:hypothetical protein SBV1_770011 [Verrucomicrobia bacterium]|nr:hypothetical protein SBV1_770011 [Verrucomicrobiota bacterium]